MNQIIVVVMKIASKLVITLRNGMTWIVLLKDNTSVRWVMKSFGKSSDKFVWFTSSKHYFPIIPNHKFNVYISVLAFIFST